MKADRLIRSLMVLGLGVLAACGTPEAGAERLEQLTEGISRDSLFRILGEGPLSASYADTMRVERGFRRSRYLVDGTMYDVIYVRDEPGDVSEAVEQSRETPIVLGKDGTVMGWGWKYYVETGIEKLRLPTPLVEAPAAPAPLATPKP